jgi:hypothetical protein
MALLSGFYVATTYTFVGIWTYVLACALTECDERIFVTLMTVKVLFFFSWFLKKF